MLKLMMIGGVLFIGYWLLKQMQKEPIPPGYGQGPYPIKSAR